MKKILLMGVSALLVMGVMAWGALQLAAPTQVSSTDAETFARANQLYQNGQYAMAAQLYQQAIANGGDDAAAYYNLGVARKASGDVKGATAAFTQAYALAPRDVQIAQAFGAPAQWVPALSSNELALTALLAATALAFALLIVLERHWLGRATAL